MTSGDVEFDKTGKCAENMKSVDKMLSTRFAENSKAKVLMASRIARTRVKVLKGEALLENISNFTVDVCPHAIWSNAAG